LHFTNPRIPLGDDDDLARQLPTVLEHRDLARCLAETGRAKARRDFDWGRISKRLLAIDQDLVQVRRSTPAQESSP